MPKIIPNGFELIEDRIDGYMLRGKIYGHRYSVIISENIEMDGKNWRHISVASQKRMPDYNVMKFINALFTPKHIDSYEVHAKNSKHVNKHPNCRHLWSCLDGDVLPDFTNGTGSI